MIDSGLARMASDSPWSGLPTLEVTRISKASATQRAGRAARTAPGRVIRLYTLDDFERRRDQDPPEILRRELSELCLTLRAMGVSNPLDVGLAGRASFSRCYSRGGLAGKPGRNRRPGTPHGALSAASALGTAGDGRRRTRRWRRRLPGGRGAQLGCAIAIVRFDEPHRFAVRSRYRAPLGANSPHRPACQAAARMIPTRWRLRSSQRFPIAWRGGVRTINCYWLPEARRCSPAKRALEFLVAVDIEDRSEHALPLVRLYCAIEPAWLAGPVSRTRAGTRGRRVESVGRARGRGKRSALRESGDRRNTQRFAGSGTGRGAAGRTRARSRNRALRRSRRIRAIPRPHRLCVRTRVDYKAGCRRGVPRTLPRSEKLRRIEGRRALR